LHSASDLFHRVTHRATARQLRLFAAACCRMEWDALPHADSRTSVLTAERFADGAATLAELDAARKAAYRVRDAGGIAKAGADVAKREAGQAAMMVMHVLGYSATRCDAKAQVAVLLDVFGNTPFMPKPSRRARWSAVGECDHQGGPFRPVAFDPDWRTAAAVGLALAAYEDGDTAAVPVLSDALEESGCGDERVLAHCRGGGRHVRGCWVVDLVLGRA
jgi:hypothetical protein